MPRAGCAHFIFNAACKQSGNMVQSSSNMSLNVSQGWVGGGGKVKQQVRYILDHNST